MTIDVTPSDNQVMEMAATINPIQQTMHHFGNRVLLKNRYTCKETITRAYDKCHVQVRLNALILRKKGGKHAKMRI